MALKVSTDNPDQLLIAIRMAIDDGTVDTWEYTTTGSFTHTTASGQWKNKAWLKPSVQRGKLTFNIIRAKGSRVSKTVYAVYHGRFAEMLLTHFDSNLSEISLTALAEETDLV